MMSARPAGQCGPRMAIDARLFQAIDGVFEKCFSPPAVEAFVRSGSYLLRLRFANKRLADDFLPSFLRDESGAPDLQIGFLTSAEADLTHLIPQPPTAYRAITRDELFAMWQ